MYLSKSPATDKKTTWSKVKSAIQKNYWSKKVVNCKLLK